MQANDKPEFGRVLLAMAEVHGKTLTAEAVTLWWNTLHFLSIEQFKTLAQRLMLESEFMPKPADFAKLMQADTGRSWSAAWEELLHNHGETRDPVGQKALRALGGWRTVGYVDTDKLTFYAKQFQEHYENYEDATPMDERLMLAAPKSSPALPRKAPASIRDLLATESDDDWRVA